MGVEEEVTVQDHNGILQSMLLYLVLNFLCENI